MDKLTKIHLRKYLGHGHEPTFSVDELQGLMLQVSFAIMMIFMIAYFMFKAESTREQDEQILELQKQKLVAAVETIQNEYELRYGLQTLQTVGEDGAIHYDASACIVDGRLTQTPLLRTAFSNGAVNASKDYADMLALRRDWFDRVLVASEVDERTLKFENRAWIGEAIDSGIAVLQTDVTRIQLLSAALLQKYWINHPERIQDPAVSELLAEFKRSDESRRLLLATELSAALKRYALVYLSEEAGAAMLSQ